MKEKLLNIRMSVEEVTTTLRQKHKMNDTIDFILSMMLLYYRETRKSECYRYFYYAMWNIAGNLHLSSTRDNGFHPMPYELFMEFHVKKRGLRS